jgi:carbamoyltransferase
MDLARSVQDVTEEVILRMARHAKKITGSKNLCLAGGVALNCVGNGKIFKERVFENIWVQPAAGDAGGAVGAALCAWYQYLGNPRKSTEPEDSFEGSFLGPEYDDDFIGRFAAERNLRFEKISKMQIPERVADLIAAQNVIGWFQGRMEFGPRALGARSILGDARSPKMQEVMNVKIKFRESFRPFAPSVIREKVSEYFELDTDSPYMLLVAPVKENHRRMMSANEEKLFGIEKLNVVRSDIPAVTHVDYSARIQTVHRPSNPLYYEMIKKFDEKHGCSVIINTSFNVRGEPLVCTPKDAYRCFMRTNMDYLIMGSYLFDKKDQPALKEDKDWRKEFELD